MWRCPRHRPLRRQPRRMELGWGPGSREDSCQPSRRARRPSASRLWRWRATQPARAARPDPPPPRRFRRQPISARSCRSQAHRARQGRSRNFRRPGGPCSLRCSVRRSPTWAKTPGSREQAEWVRAPRATRIPRWSRPVSLRSLLSRGRLPAVLRPLGHCRTVRSFPRPLRHRAIRGWVPRPVRQVAGFRAPVPSAAALPLQAAVPPELPERVPSAAALPLQAAVPPELPERVPSAAALPLQAAVPPVGCFPAAVRRRVLRWEARRLPSPYRPRSRLPRVPASPAAPRSAAVGKGSQ